MLTIVAGFLLLALLLGVFLGGVWVAFKVYPWVRMAASIAFLLSVFIFTPMLIFRKSRAWGGVALFFSSYLFGFCCWVFSFAVTLETLGVFWLLVGLSFLGVGIVPLAMIGSAWDGLWRPFWDIALALIVTLAARFIGIWAAAPKQTVEWTDEGETVKAFVHREAAN